jgi:hypothetical protein
VPSMRGACRFSHVDGGLAKEIDFEGRLPSLRLLVGGNAEAKWLQYHNSLWSVPARGRHEKRYNYWKDLVIFPWHFRRLDCSVAMYSMACNRQSALRHFGRYRPLTAVEALLQWNSNQKEHEIKQTYLSSIETGCTLPYVTG